MEKKIQEGSVSIKEYISQKEQKQLEEWTRLKCKDIVFDTNIDNWSPHT